MKYNKSVQCTIVAGGAGFIGYHLCKRLLKEGRNIVCVDNLSTGRLNNIAKFIEEEIMKSIMMNFLLGKTIIVITGVRC